MRIVSKFKPVVVGTVFIHLLLVSCQEEQPSKVVETTPNVIVLDTIFSVPALAETTPVLTNDDAADDPCIWVNHQDKSKSLIIGTNKRYGLEVYNLTGERIQKYPLGRLNNVDVRYNFSLNQEPIDIVVATNRTYNSLTALKVDAENGDLVLLSDSILKSNVDEVYGFALGQPKGKEVLYAFLVSKTGQLEQWELKDNNGTLDGEIVRSVSLNGICEGVVADDNTGMVYINQEEVGIWKMNMDPADSSQPEMIIKIDTISNIVADIEGISIYYASETAGYLIASSQGNNTYAVFDREVPHTYMGSFRVVDHNGIDGIQETDGLDVLNLSLPGYPNGIFIAQDGFNKENGVDVNQNFKMVDWADIAKAFEPNLEINSTYIK